MMLIATVATSGLFLLIAARQVKSAQVPEYTLARSVCFAVLVSLHTNVYDLAILILPNLMVFWGWHPVQGRQWILILRLFLLFFPPRYVVAIAPFRAGPWRSWWCGCGTEYATG